MDAAKFKSPTSKKKIIPLSQNTISDLNLAISQFLGVAESEITYVLTVYFYSIQIFKKYSFLSAFTSEQKMSKIESED